MLQKCLQKAPQTYGEGGLLENLIKSRAQSIMTATSTNASTAMRKKSIRPVTQLGHQVPAPTNIFETPVLMCSLNYCTVLQKINISFLSPMADLEEASVKQPVLSGNEIYFSKQTTSNSETSGDRTATWFSLHHGYFFFFILNIKKLLADALIRNNLQQRGEAGFSVVDAITLHRIHGA